MLYILYPLAALLMLGMPIVLGAWLARRFQASWRLFGLGAVTFVGSQLVHLPLNAGLTAWFKTIWPLASASPQGWHIPFNAVILGLTAGLCEETARYIGYRWLVKQACHFRDALMLGAGHGGIEAILVGLVVGWSFLNYAAARQMDFSLQGWTGEKLAQTQRLISAYWNAPWHLVLLGVVERLFALTIHVSLSVLVLQVFTRHNWGWLALAITYHLLVDAVAVFGVQSHWSPLMIEAAVGVFALISLASVLGLRPRGMPLIPPEPEPVLVSGASPVSRSAASRETDALKQLDDSKYA